MGAASRVLGGVLLCVAACLCFAVMDTTAKFVSATVSASLAMWVRYSVQAVATAVLVLPWRGLAVLRTRHVPFQLLRGLLLLFGSFIGFISLRYVPVGEFTAILMIAPLAVTLLAATWLGERVSPLRWALVVGGFTGTLIVIRPGGEQFSLAHLLPLCGAINSAAFQVLTTKMARTEDPVTMHLYTGWVGAIGTSLAIPFFWSDLPDGRMWAVMVFMGIAGAVGHFILILAFRRAPASTLTPFMYSQIAFAMVGGWVVFGHVPDGWGVAGMAMIAVCGAAGAWLTAREQVRLPEASPRNGRH